MRFSDEYKLCIHNLHATQTEGSSKFGELIAESVIMSGYLRMAMNTDVHSRPCASVHRDNCLGDRRPKGLAK
jgi:hypothetical protein